MMLLSLQRVFGSVVALSKLTKVSDQPPVSGEKQKHLYIDNSSVAVMGLVISFSDKLLQPKFRKGHYHTGSSCKTQR